MYKKHILAIFDIKKMIPVPENCYEKLDFKMIQDKSYYHLIKKEYIFV
ncbi:type III toxin-antitoxin system ToxN/AbiQ family toxin [Carnobacteriaceae bacterium zg-ZUI78]|nr:type III toxin-antitoxin system ToxN/AbiQ family toxin [Carnobacteriaceae bacterium zg-ZUI78]NEW66787.1 hypothetical protein [Granulicatella sp. zg-84]QMI85063.1 type III toxin-antitoxin system ToxN/AbiQ family toxin [Carnobacteriaceae bacterium zg-84]